MNENEKLPNSGKDELVQIMPFRIVVERTWDLSKCHAHFFSREGQEMYCMIKPEGNGHSVDFSQTLFCELLGIHNSSGADAFLSAHEHFRFAYYRPDDLYGLGIGEYETREAYCKAVASGVTYYKWVLKYITLKDAYTRDPDPEMKKTLAALYPDLFVMLGMGNSRYSTFNQMRDDYYEMYDHVDEVLEQMLERRGEFDYLSEEELYQMLEEDYFAGKEELRAQHEAQARQKVEEAVDSRMYAEVIAYVDKVLASVNISFDTGAMSFVCKCPDLISAMYMMIYVSLRNGERYEMCASKDCGCYFLVNKAHPQKRCPKHMAARQHARQNQRKYAEDPSFYQHGIK